MLELLLAWLLLMLAITVMVASRPAAGGALTLAYFVGLSLIHVPGLLPFAFSDLYLANAEATKAGFELTLLGMAGFLLGALVVRAVMRPAIPEAGMSAGTAQSFGRLGMRAFGFGIAAYFILVPLSFSVPSLNSIASAMATLLILGCWLMLYGARLARDDGRTVAIIALLPLLPMATLVSGGFLGYGVYWVLSIVAFLFVVARQRTFFYLAAPIAIYLGLSLFVTYMGQRAGIRDLVWRERATLVDRIDRAATLVTDFRLLDLDSRSHVTALDERLNQNALVGAAIMHHEAGLSGFAYGATVPIWALVPRALWPDKPAVGGGLNLVSDFTGIRFAAGTSVGTGQVLEFYVNFGVPGVLAGFILLGALLAGFDREIMRALAVGDMRVFLVHAMPGLTLLQPGGNLLEIVVAVVAAYVMALVVAQFGLLNGPRPARLAAGS